jgi:uncharacterized SAM-binding protein YcdF (DUF218 family)
LNLKPSVKIMGMIADMMRLMSPLAEPLGLLWLLMCLVAVMLLLMRRWLGALALAICAAAFSFVGATSLGENLLGSLERPYIHSSINEAPVCDAVIMLGGIHRASAYDAFGFDLGNGADRIVTAVELMRLRKAKTLVLSGGVSLAGKEKTNPAVLFQKWFVSWDIPAGQVVYLAPCRNTWEEALAVKELARQQKWSRLLLVSSAYHLRRAEAVFKKTGLDVTSVGCDFQVVGTEKGTQFSGPVPRSVPIGQLECYLHEELGWWLYRANGWVGDSSPTNANASGVGKELPASKPRSN